MGRSDQSLRFDRREEEFTLPFKPSPSAAGLALLFGFSTCFADLIFLRAVGRRVFFERFLAYYVPSPSVGVPALLLIRFLLSFCTAPVQGCQTISPARDALLRRCCFPRQVPHIAELCFWCMSTFTLPFRDAMTPLLEAECRPLRHSFLAVQRPRDSC